MDTQSQLVPAGANGAWLVEADQAAEDTHVIAHSAAVWLEGQTSVQTKRAYKKALQELCEVLAVGSPAALVALTPLEFIRYRDHLVKEKGLKHRSVRNRLSAVSSLFGHLRDEQLIKTNPLDAVPRPPVATEKGVTPAMATDQARRMLEWPDPSTVAGARDAAVLHTLFFTACRIAELGSLTVGDFYEEQGFAMLRFIKKRWPRAPRRSPPSLETRDTSLSDARGPWG